MGIDPLEPALALARRNLDESGVAERVEFRPQRVEQLAAEVKRGELMGYYVERRENTNTNYNISDKPLTPDEWADQYVVGAPARAAKH